MPSPFPGMDPYLEAQPYWSTLHANLITAMQGELKKRVPRNYSVWSDVYIWLHEPDAKTRAKRLEPDVFLSEEHGVSATKTAELIAPANSLLPAIRRKGNRYLKTRMHCSLVRRPSQQCYRKSEKNSASASKSKRCYVPASRQRRMPVTDMSLFLPARKTHESRWVMRQRPKQDVIGAYGNCGGELIEPWQNSRA